MLSSPQDEYWQTVPLRISILTFLCVKLIVAFGGANDGTPIFFDGARSLNQRLLNELRRDETLDLFVVVTTENDFLTGTSGLSPLVGVDVDGPFGDSFLSINGCNFDVAEDLNFGIQLLFTWNDN